jgi:N-acetylmuramoyl-L-alanine amidase
LLYEAKVSGKVTGKETIQLINRRHLQYGVVVFSLLLACLLPIPGESAQQNRHRVLIDPAHGGEDSGVVADKLREKDATMSLALLIREESQKADELQVRLTRSADRTMTVAERLKAVGDFNPDCVICLHINAGFGKKAGGYEVYFPGFRQNVSGKGDSSPVLKDMAKNRALNDSVRLAQQIQANLETVFPRKGRGLRDAPNPFLDGLAVPGLVVEVGFATNPDDRQGLTDGAIQRAMARAVVKGLRDYFRAAP